MKILLVNDDGYKCAGLTVLADMLHEKHSVYVVAPEKERSGSSHALTFTDYISAEKIDAAYPFYKLKKGTPCDCVKYGILVLGERFDAVISGINTTINIANDCIYSGTVNAAAEGAMNGVPSIAVSAEAKNGDYSYLAEFISNNLEYLLSFAKGDKFVNLNFPSTEKEEIKGIEFTRCGIKLFDDHYDHEDKGSILRGSPIDIENEEDTDVECIKKNKASLTVMRLMFDVDVIREKEVKVCW